MGNKNSIFYPFRLPIRRKAQIFQAVIASKLLYGLSTAWLNTAEQRRLNGFQARCLRRVCNIKASYVSRVSNAKVLEKAGQITFLKQLLKQQLKLFRKVYNVP